MKRQETLVWSHSHYTADIDKVLADTLKSTPVVSYTVDQTINVLTKRLSWLVLDTDHKRLLLRKIIQIRFKRLVQLNEATEILIDNKYHAWIVATSPNLPYLKVVTQQSDRARSAEAIRLASYSAVNRKKLQQVNQL